MSIAGGALRRGAETERSRPWFLDQKGDWEGDADRSVNGVEGDSGPVLGDDFQPKKEVNLFACCCFDGDIVCVDPMLWSDTDLGRFSAHIDMSGCSSRGGGGWKEDWFLEVEEEVEDALRFRTGRPPCLPLVSVSLTCCNGCDDERTGYDSLTRWRERVSRVPLGVSVDRELF